MDLHEVAGYAGTIIASAITGIFGLDQWKKRQRPEKKSDPPPRPVSDPLGGKNRAELQDLHEQMSLIMQLVRDVHTKQEEESASGMEHRTILREQIERLIERLEKQNQAIHDVHQDMVSILRRLIP